MQYAKLLASVELHYIVRKKIVFTVEDLSPVGLGRGAPALYPPTKLNCTRFPHSFKQGHLNP